MDIVVQLLMVVKVDFLVVSLILLDILIFISMLVVQKIQELVLILFVLVDLMVADTVIHTQVVVELPI